MGQSLGESKTSFGIILVCYIKQRKFVSKVGDNLCLIVDLH